MELMLRKNEILDLGGNLSGLDIICREGRCWLTQAGDSRDHLLNAGHRFNNHQNGQLLVTALDDCRLILVATADSKAASPWKQLCYQD